MSDKGLLCTGAAGSVIAAICCFTPVLVIAFGLIGLSAWVGWLDYVLFPMLAFFLALTGYVLYRIRQGRLASAAGDGKATEGS
jgi:mercuric ion transport protein